MEAGCDAFSLLRPARALSPVIFASGHSGRNYPAEFVAAARLDALALRRSEDCFVDQLFASAPELGAPLLLAHFPRAYCDANREPWELDPAMFEGVLPPWVNSASPRVGAGLGTIARVVSTGEPIYRGKLPFAEAEARVRNCWQPYHAALAALIAETRAQFGVCILIDCHSMPSAPTVYGPLPDMVLGDAHGTTCSPRITRLVEQTLGGFGYRLGRNDPYAGGYVTRHYGRPREAVHVLQLELCRKLYMDEAQIRPNDGMERLAGDLRRLTSTLVGADWGFLG
ncbi:N-formylglutamate amidohydrolase [Rhodovarius crocodyli]|uniref:N-formylglutamate amidohydrolase n=1 Tax=Rhodovarius crocodyli TaxID=1979269 RepID=A0A437MPV5_9PROT|nr:N-formylglutamate amidohydrolase [Rhodovarius crocodyli]RVT99670.1 N-formylglutamate amidohydrolase [Rhodovarius crocodyli]